MQIHDNILSIEQKQLLPFIQSFKKEYYLVGGTAVSLQIGHRESIDFDLFKTGTIQPRKIAQRLQAFGWDYQLLHKNEEGFHIIVNGVKVTFFQYPFNILATQKYEGIKMPDLLHLAAMKAYALGRRAKWKDYADLYFILRDYHSVEEISTTAHAIFEGLFSPKLFKQQLCYFNGINYSEEITYCIDPVSDDTIKAFLTEIATKPL
jgi:hypothetical protein